jgi:hypothetical protein
MAVFEITSPPSGPVDLGQVDDSGFRGAGLALAAAPFIYLAGVPVCFAVGRLLMSLGFQRLGSFLGGTAVIAVLLGFIAGVILSFPSRYSLNDVALSVLIASMLFSISAVPASLCWWLFAVRPHNSSLHTDAQVRQ